ncbi:MAG: hypothetical protein ACJAVI_000018 [Candidatus Azotimanducaceae bacterium]|jgi:hypothetical protein
MVSKKKTGIFYVKDPEGVVVMWDGKEVSRYLSVNELVETHLKGLSALEREMNEAIEAQYRP